MKALTKLSCLILCLALLLGSLTSCDTLKELVDKYGDNITLPSGGDEIDPNKYAASVRIVFATNDDKMKAAVDAMSSSSTILSDGFNLSVHTTANTGSASVENTYTYINGMIFHRLLIQSGEISVEKLERSAFDDSAAETLLNKAGAGASIDTSDFNTCDASEGDVVSSYICSDIKDDAKASLEGIITSRFAAIGADVKLEDVYFTLDTKNDVATSSVLSCSFKITMDGKIYEITMHTYTDYDYSADVQIDIPDNFGSYSDVSYEDIIG